MATGKRFLSVLVLIISCPSLTLAGPEQPTHSQAGTGGDNCNEATPHAIPVPGTISIFGDNSSATGPDDCAGGITGTIWWEAFTIAQCADVEISFCGSTPRIWPPLVLLQSTCSMDGSSCPGRITPTDSNVTFCADENFWMFIPGLPAGTYYYPIRSDTASAYQMNITTFECIGACCNPEDATCAEDVAETNCSGAGDQLFPNQTCLTSGCQGACCNPQNENCVDNVFSPDCQSAGDQFRGGEKCCTLECRELRCIDDYDAAGVTLMSNVPLSDFAGPPAWANDIWGYVSPSGREYAIIGVECAFAFIEVSDPFNPVIITEVPGSCSTWRDTAIFGEFAYGVSDQVSDGLYIMDLTNVDSGIVNTNVVNLPMGTEFFRSAHNAIVNPDSGFLYMGGSNTNSGRGLAVIDVGTEPDNPVFVGHWDAAPFLFGCHDMQVISYTSGPNSGKEIAFCYAGGRGLVIGDVTDKNNMFTISNLIYPNTAFAHQGWIDDARQYLYLGDEADETDFDIPTTTYVIDVQDLANPFLHTTFTNNLCSIDHNQMVRGTKLYQANYSSGLRVYDISDVDNIHEIGHFDTLPGHNFVGFGGAWGTYPLLPSGIILVSDRGRGLFVLAECDEPDCEFDSCCLQMDPPQLPAVTSHSDQPKNRSLSLVPTNPGKQTALRVTLTSSTKFPSDVSKQWWVTAPVEICENSGEGPGTAPANCGPAPGIPKKTMWSSSLTCSQICLDWNAPTDVNGNPLDVLHISDADIVTGSTYTIEAIDCDCDPLDSGSFSAPLVLNTSRWGDLSGGLPSDCPRQAPDTSVDLILDCVAVLNKFSNMPCAMLKARVDIEPQIPDLEITIADVLRCVNAFAGFPYPFPGPVGCP